MDIELDPGRYVVAVSGGVDSVVLLDLLAKKPGLELIVAHFDHGIRSDSGKDCEFVASLAKNHKLTFESRKGKLGPNASEAAAREARYDFLNSVAQTHKAQAILTAHHQDDLIETALLNLIRGTGRRGLSSLKSSDQIIRPLLDLPKQEIINYAKAHDLTWYEDPTNQDTKYLRNHIRHDIVPKLSAEQRKELIDIIKEALKSNQQIDGQLEAMLQKNNKESVLGRQWFGGLPHDVSKEVMLAWLRLHKIGELNRRQIEDLVVKSKTYKINSQIDVNKLYIIKVTKKHLALGQRDR